MSERRKRARLSRSGDFDRVYRDGRSHANRFLVLYAFPRTEDGSEGARLGTSVGRKVGGAVQRNAVKRALRTSMLVAAARVAELGEAPAVVDRVATQGLKMPRSPLQEIDIVGAASVLDGEEKPLPPVKTSVAASTPASANIAMVPSSNAHCVLLNRDCRGFAGGMGGGGW